MRSDDAMIGYRLNLINRFELFYNYYARKNPKEYANKHYQENKGKYAESSKKARQNKRNWYNSIMADKSCIKCGESDRACLDWHHTDPSKKNILLAFFYVIGVENLYWKRWKNVFVYVQIVIENYTITRDTGLIPVTLIVIMTHYD